MRRRALVILAALALLSAVAGWRYHDLPMIRCAWCQSPGRPLNGLNRHHVQQQAARPDLRDDPANLIVLCRRCHYVLGHRCDWRQANPDVAVICATYTNTVRLAAKSTE